MAAGELKELWGKGTEFLGSRYAILGGAMSWLSESNLVAAISNAGGFGVIASGNMPPELYRGEIKKTQSKTNQPFGVNLITMNPELPELIQVTIDEGVTHCVLAGGVPDAATIARLKDNGIKVVAFAPTLAFAKRLVRQGADALVIEGSEAGGHIGPVSTSVLAQEILPFLTTVPIFVAGGIATGAMVAQYLKMGAAGCQLGTRFVCAEECVAHPNFKKTFIRAKSRDAVATAQFDPILPVIPVRALVNQGTREFNNLQLKLVGEVKAGRLERDEAVLDMERFWVGALKKAAIDGDMESGSIMAGQSVGLVSKVEPVAAIIDALVSDAEKSLN